MKKIISAILLLVLCMNPYFRLNTSAEEGWPDHLEIGAEGGILMDADSGVVLYGKNIEEKYYPASITKILTALIVIENCDLDEELIFSHDAVHNVEENSSSAGYETGDSVPVRDALYALLLKSANEAANALAEHCAGSVEAFCEMMNEKAASLGCVNSNFANPSGLNDENHYTCAYDFALIAKAAFENPTLREIASTTYYRLPPTKKTPEGLEIYNHHGMLKKRNENYYEWAVCGKTGYTMLAGHTLVTLGEKDGLRLITVVLNAYRTHYKDTKSMMEFGFRNFKSINISKTGFLQLDTNENINLLGSRDDLPYIEADENSFITLPRQADLEEISYSINYDLDASEQDFAVAKIEYTYGGRGIGKTYLKIAGVAETAESMEIIEASQPAQPMKTAPPLHTLRGRRSNKAPKSAAVYPNQSPVDSRAVPECPLRPDSSPDHPENPEEKAGGRAGAAAQGAKEEKRGSQPQHGASGSFQFLFDQHRAQHQQKISQKEMAVQEKINVQIYRFRPRMESKSRCGSNLR